MQFIGRRLLTLISICLAVTLVQNCVMAGSTPSPSNGKLEDGALFNGVQLGALRSELVAALAAVDLEFLETKVGGRCLTTLYPKGTTIDVFYDRKRRGTVCAVIKGQVLAALEWMFVPTSP